MTIRSPLLMLVLVAVAAAPAAPDGAAAQHTGAAPPPSSVAPREASQFDFLIGQWELVVRPAASGLAQKIHGVPKLVGTWKAWRALDGWGVEDDLHITDASGNPRTYSHAVRVWDAAAHRWTTSALEVYRGTFTSSTAEWKDGQMVATSRGTNAEGKPYVTRTRYHDITAKGFSFQQDRSMDEGKTWEESLKMEAKRVAAVAPR